MGITKTARIGIIGAGPAGISAAYYLQEAGYEAVTVIEKNDYLGGKCLSDSFGAHEGIFEMGAIELTQNQTYLYQVIDQLNKTLPESQKIQPVEMPAGTLISPYNGNTYPTTYILNDLSPLEWIEFFEQAVHYYVKVKLMDKELKSPGFLNLNRERTQSFSSWLDLHNMPLLKRIFFVPICCYGYGALEDIPAAYALKYLNADNFLSFLFQKIALPIPSKISQKVIHGIYKSLDPIIHEFIKPLERIDEIGYQGLLNHMAATFKKPVILNADITSIDRNGGTVKVSLADKTVLVFDKLIVTVPPFVDENAPGHAPRLELLNMNLTNEEAELFKDVTRFNYCTFAVEMKAFQKHGYAEIVGKEGNIALPEDGSPIMFYQRETYSSDRRVVVFYCYSKEAMSLETMKKNLIANIKSITKDEVHILEEQIFDQQQWNYFPHVKEDGLARGFYDRLDQLQGQQNSYWTGGLLNFELVENTFHYSSHLVNDILQRD